MRNFRHELTKYQYGIQGSRSLQEASPPEPPWHLCSSNIHHRSTQFMVAVSEGGSRYRLVSLGRGEEQNNSIGYKSATWASGVGDYY